MTRNVLIIEDNPGIGELVRMHVAELDRVLRLEMEAEDYLTKPFSVAELSVRVKALFRRVDAMAYASLEKIRAYLSACVYRLIHRVKPKPRALSVAQKNAHRRRWALVLMRV